MRPYSEGINMIGLTRILYFPKNKYLVQQKRPRSISKFSACVCLLTKKRYNDRPWFTHYKNKVLHISSEEALIQLIFRDEIQYPCQHNDRPWFTHYTNKVLLHTRGQYLPRYTCTAAVFRFSVIKNTNKITVGISASV